MYSTYVYVYNLKYCDLGMHYDAIQVIKKTYAHYGHFHLVDLPSALHL